RFLRRGGVVEVNEGLSVDFLVQDGEVVPQSFPVSHFLMRKAGIQESEVPFCFPDEIYISPSCNFAASLSMLWFQGGSQTSSTETSSTDSRLSNLFCTSCCNTGPMPQPGAVKVIFTPTRKLSVAMGSMWQS